MPESRRCIYGRTNKQPQTSDLPCNLHAVGTDIPAADGFNQQPNFNDLPMKLAPMNDEEDSQGCCNTPYIMARNDEATH